MSAGLNVHRLQLRCNTPAIYRYFATIMSSGTNHRLQLEATCLLAIMMELSHHDALLLFILGWNQQQCITHVAP